MNAACPVEVEVEVGVVKTDVVAIACVLVHTWPLSLVPTTVVIPAIEVGSGVVVVSTAPSPTVVGSASPSIDGAKVAMTFYWTTHRDRFKKGRREQKPASSRRTTDLMWTASDLTPHAQPQHAL